MRSLRTGSMPGSANQAMSSLFTPALQRPGTETGSAYEGLCAHVRPALWRSAPRSLAMTTVVILCLGLAIARLGF